MDCGARGGAEDAAGFGLVAKEIAGWGKLKRGRLAEEMSAGAEQVPEKGAIGIEASKRMSLRG